MLAYLALCKYNKNKYCNQLTKLSLYIQCNKSGHTDFLSIQVFKTKHYIIILIIYEHGVKVRFTLLGRHVGFICKIIQNLVNLIVQVSLKKKLIPEN